LPEKFKTEQRAVLTWFAYSCLGGEAQAGLDALRALPSEWVKDAAYTGPTALLYGELLLRDGKPALAIPRFEEAYADWSKRKLEVAKSPEEAWLQPYLLMRLGRLREARAMYQLWATEWPRPFRETVKINWWLWSPITIGLIVGEEEAALSLLRDAVEIPAAKRVLRTVLRVDWRLAPFRNNPAIAKILADEAR
jgi:tetratricopeptide (TPR) repeat protein